MQTVDQPAPAPPGVEAPNIAWYSGVPKYAWIVLAVASLGWLFDTMDQHLFNLLRQQSVVELLRGTVAPAALDGTAKNVGAWLTAIFLVGWAAGGFLFGIVGDRIGRTRTMVMTVLIYASFTGLNGLVHTTWQYAACRFLTALGVGGEFAAGTSLVAEVWPERSRPMALGTLQALSAVGNIFAALVTLAMSAVSWRWAFAVGIAPALLTLWIRASLHEPERWQRARIAARASAGPGERGMRLGSLRELFETASLRRSTAGGILLALAGVGGVWGAAFFLPDLVGSALKPHVLALSSVAALPPVAKASAVRTILQAYRSKVSLVNQAGAFFGIFAYAALSQRIGRKPGLAIAFVLAFAAIQATFRWLREPLSAYLLAAPLGFCTLAPFSAYAVYFPELYPTRLRSTGVGICYNGARILAAAAPLTLGRLAVAYARPGDDSAGIRTAACIVSCIYLVGLVGLLLTPETRGKPLPE